MSKRSSSGSDHSFSSSDIETGHDTTRDFVGEECCLRVGDDSKGERGKTPSEEQFVWKLAKLFTDARWEDSICEVGNAKCMPSRIPAAESMVCHESRAFRLASE